MDAKEIRERFEAKGIRHVKVGGFDVDGILRGKLVSLDKFWGSVEKGFGFCDVIFGWDSQDALYDNAKVTGWHTGYPDTPSWIDLATFRVLPYEPDTAAFLVDFRDADGKAHPACPRSLLKRIDARARAAGYAARFSAEFEFWVFEETPQSLHAKHFQDLKSVSPGMFGYSWLREAQRAPFLHDILDACERFDIHVEGLHTETGPGVFEVAIAHDEALGAADQAALFKTLMKEIAGRHGLCVTFMAKWNAKLPGSSGHLHQSLWDAAMTTPLFHDAKGPDGLSPLALHYIGGLCKLAPELTALFAPTINAYKRYVPGVWAPTTASWAVENRTSAIRVINGPGKNATRVEFRQTAADINPYIAMATCLAAGLWGIEHAVAPPERATGDASKAKNLPPIPHSLERATEALRASAAAKEILGAEFVDHYARTREWEVRQYQKSVSDWELERYFEGA